MIQIFRDLLLRSPLQYKNGRCSYLVAATNHTQITHLYFLSLTHQQQDKLAAQQSAWKDYSANGGHHTNYAYEPFDHPANASAAPPTDDLKRQHLIRNTQGPPAHTNGTLPRPTVSSRGGAPLPPHPRNGGNRVPPPPSGPGYSLPRATNGSGNGYGSAGSYGSYDRRIGYGGGGPPLPGHHPAGSDFAPDHYFMPSQRKYSGEFLRVYVDYNK